MTDLIINESNFTAEEALVFHKKLWNYMAAVSKNYTEGKNTSLSTETANRLLGSVLFLLNEYIISTGKNYRDLLDIELYEAVNFGRNVLLSRCSDCRELLKKAQLSVSKVPSFALIETLKNINNGFYRYNTEFFAADIPCSISYQLIKSVPDNFLGAEYLFEYLKRILLENYIINKFDPRKLRKLLIRISPFYSELLINICEVALQNAVGLSVIGEDIFSLEITPEMREELVKVYSKPKEQVIILTEKAADEICDKLLIFGSEERNYIKEFALGLLPRISASICNKLQGVFI